MIRSIVVPLDGSRAAERAIPVASRLARSGRAGLRLVRAHEAALVGAGIDEERDELRYLADTAAPLERTGVELALRVLEGNPDLALEQYLLEEAPEFVVMAVPEVPPTAATGTGNLVDHLLRVASVPLLLVPSGGADEPPGVPVRILVSLAAADLADQPAKGLDRLAWFAALNGAHVTLLHVVNGPAGGRSALAGYPSRVVEALQSAWRQAQRKIDALADELRLRGVSAGARVVIAPDATSTVMEQSERGHMDFVVLWAHGEGRGSDPWTRVVADSVIRHLSRPVLLLPPLPSPPPT